MVIKKHALFHVQILFRIEREGDRLPKPADCPQELYSVMRKCWACNPTDRPTFAELTTLVAEVSPQRTPKLCIKLLHSSHVEHTPLFMTCIL